MKNKIAKKILSLGFVLIGCIALHSNVLAAPYSGEAMQLKQPNGTYVNVKVYGDEFYQRVESTDGYTLIREPKSDWICYAKLSTDGSTLVSTGIVYGNIENKIQGITSFNALNLTKGIKVKPEYVKKEIEKTQKELNWKDFIQDAQKQNILKSQQNLVSNNATTGASLPYIGDVSGNIKGLTLLIDFPDVPSSVSKSELDNMFNAIGYSGFSNNGSIRDYFFDVSGGKLTYTNKITAFYTAKHPKSYYDKTTGYYTDNAKELITEALQYFSSNGFDFTGLVTDYNGAIKCLNVMYAGTADCGWSKGLWPHASSLGNIDINGVKFNRYQITSIGNSPCIGTIVHENGHMLCGWPDTYDYGRESSGTGSYDLMSTGWTTNPTLPDPYCKNIITGWGNLKVLNDYNKTTDFTVAANSVDSIIYLTSKSNEFFIIENMKAKGRRENIPDEGLAVWHIDTYGNNDNEQMTPSKHYQVSLEQADGLFHLEHGINYGDTGDLFHAGYVDSFGPNGKVNSNTWDGKATTLNINNISSIGKNMTFTYTPDTEAPSAPTNVRTILIKDNAITLGWNPSTDNVGIKQYLVFADIMLENGMTKRTDVIGSSTGNTCTVPLLGTNALFNFYVIALDQSNNMSPMSEYVTISTDTVAPEAPTNLKYTTLSDTSLILTWDMPYDNLGVTGYYVYDGERFIGNLSTNTYTINYLTPNTSHSFRVKAYDYAGNVSKESAALVVTTNASK